MKLLNIIVKLITLIIKFVTKNYKLIFVSKSTTCIFKFIKIKLMINKNNKTIQKLKKYKTNNVKLLSI